MVQQKLLKKFLILNVTTHKLYIHTRPIYLSTMIQKSDHNLLYYSGKDHPNSLHGRIERCLKLMSKSGRETFTVKSVEKATGLKRLSVVGILNFTEGVANMGVPTKRPRERIWYFTGEPINVSVVGDGE